MDARRGASLNPSIDESAAWTLVRAIRPGPDGKDAPIRVHHDSSPDLWLQVQGSGRWRTSAPPTPAARDLLELFLPLAVRERFVIGQLGQSLDGRIATASGHSHYVTGPEDIVRLHRLRALADAVLVGARTVVSDDPRLTVREVEGEDPTRVILDPGGRIASDRRIFTGGGAPTLVIRSAGAADPVPLPAGVAVTLDAAEGRGFEPAEIVRALGERGLRRILVEGGGVTVSRFLQAGVLDRLHVTVAPLVIGSGRPGIRLDPVETLDEALRPPCRRFHLGDDVLFDLDLGGAGSS